MLYLRSENRQEKNYEKNNKRHENNRIQRRESMDPKMASRRRRSIKHIIISQRADSQHSEPISCGPAWACERVWGEKILWDGRVSTSQTTAETVHTSDLLRWPVRDRRNKLWPSLTLKGVVQHLTHMFAELQMRRLETEGNLPLNSLLYTIYLIQSAKTTLCVGLSLGIRWATQLLMVASYSADEYEC